MDVERTDGYECISNDFVSILNVDGRLSIGTKTFKKPIDNTIVRQLAQHLIQWVETGSLVIEKASDMIVRTLETDHGYVTGEPVSIAPMSKDAKEWLEADNKMLNEVIRPRLKAMQNPQVVEVTPNGTKIIKDVPITVDVEPTIDWGNPVIYEELKPDG